MRLDRSLPRFLVAGGATVGVDALVYSILLALDLPIDLAKALALCVATAFAYVVNRLWTFRAIYGGVPQIVSFLALYGCAIALNVAVNRLCLLVFGLDRAGLAFAWFFATAASSSWNYVGMRLFVFRHTRGS